MSGEGRFFEQVYALVARIPRGRVVTYGQIAALLGVTRGARAVGWALRVLDEPRARRLPWHRVVGAGGRISPRAGIGPVVQRKRLQAEGVRFRNGRVDIARHGVLAAPRLSRESVARPRASQARRWSSRRRGASLVAGDARARRPRRGAAAASPGRAGA